MSWINLFWNVGQQAQISELKDVARDAKYDAQMSRKFNRCLFCGEEYTEGSAFDTV